MSATDVIEAGTSGVQAGGVPGVDFHADIREVRRLARAVPGPLPVAVNGIKVAESIRPRKFVIAGGDETPVPMPRTAFQVVYADGTIMLDSGLDRATHDSFADGRAEPYFAGSFARLQRALDAARLIVLTHFHADHVAGVLQAANFAQLAAKTLVTGATADLLINKPHRPHLKITEDAARKFIRFDYRQYFPVAPGLVLIDAPGHSPDSQMVYVRLQSGREILHSVDTAWNIDNIRTLKGKAAPWVKEDAAAIEAQLRWLKNIDAVERDISILVTHDGARFDELTRNSVLGELAT